MAAALLGASRALGNDHSHQHGNAGFLLTMDHLDWVSIGTVLLYGFGTSWHCAAMCGPLASACIGNGPGRKKFWKGAAAYNFGRGVSYVGLSAALAMVASELVDVLHRVGTILSVFAAMMFAWMAIRVYRPRAGGSLEQTIAKFLARVLPRQGNPLRPMAFGLMTVFLPCATLSPVIVFAATSTDPLLASAVTGAFFIGTLPTMAIAPNVPRWGLGLGLWGSKRLVMFAFYVICAVLSILRCVH